MSADNYLLMREHEGRYVVTMEFASDDHYSPLTNQRAEWFDTYSEALDHIHKEYDDPDSYMTFYEYGPVILCDQPLWENNEIQFARLLCEIRATADNLDVESLLLSMDLDESQLEELFDRAYVVFEAAKGNL